MIVGSFSALVVATDKIRSYRCLSAITWMHRSCIFHGLLSQQKHAVPGRTWAKWTQRSSVSWSGIVARISVYKPGKMAEEELTVEKFSIIFIPSFFASVPFYLEISLIASRGVSYQFAERYFRRCVPRVTRRDLSRVLAPRLYRRY